MLDAAGMIPILGAIADAANAAWYGAEGKWDEAGLSAMAAIPGLGDLAAMARWGKRGMETVSAARRVHQTMRALDLGANVSQSAVAVYGGIENGNLVQAGMGVLGLGVNARSLRRLVGAADMARAATGVPAALLRNSQGRYLRQNYTAYIGMKKGKAVYAGVTRQSLADRLTQHGERFDRLVPVGEQLTRRQARALEQVLIERNPQFQNAINSIARNRVWYNDAVTWARRVLGE